MGKKNKKMRAQKPKLKTKKIKWIDEPAEPIDEIFHKKVFGIVRGINIFGLSLDVCRNEGKDLGRPAQ